METNNNYKNNYITSNIKHIKKNYNGEDCLFLSIIHPLNDNKPETKEHCEKVLKILGHMTLVELKNQNIQNKFVHAYINNNESMKSLFFFKIFISYLFYRRQRFTKNKTIFKSFLYSFVILSTLNILTIFTDQSANIILKDYLKHCNIIENSNNFDDILAKIKEDNKKTNYY